MNSELLDRAEAEFHRITGLPEEEREAALRELEGRESALGVLVRELLASDDEATFMRAAPAHGVAGSEWSTRGARSILPVRLGRYEILRILGEGGMGLVYEARQDVPNRHVALKVMRGGLVTREALTRFQREAELLGSLRHPGIAAIYDAGWARPEYEDGPGHEQPFLAMELIRGCGFLEAARGLDRSARLELFAGVCDAVGFAHARGIVHRDLKPSNVLVDESGAPKVLDFGVARVTEGSAFHAGTLVTEAGRVIGTLGYISPEQHDTAADPVRRAIDQRADVYALGVMLFETLTGRTPHELQNRSLVEAARIVRDEEPTRLGAIDRGLRGDLETIVSKAIERDPSRRYPDAAALALDIRRYLRDETIAARPTSASYRLWKFTRRHRVLVSAVSAVILALSGGLAASIRFAARESVARRDADGQRRRAEGEAYRANIAAAQAAMLADDGAMAAGHLDRADPALRGWEYHHVRHSLETWRRREPLPEGSPTTVVSPPDRGPPVMFDGDSTLTFPDPGGSLRVVRLPGTSKIGGVDAGRSVVACLDGLGRASCVEIKPGAAEAVARWTHADVRSKWPPAISPDGRFVACVEGDETRVAVYDAATGAEVRTLDVRASFPPPAFSPDGRTLLVSRLETSVTAFDWPSGELLWQKPAGFQSFSSDGSLAVLTATEEGRSWALVADTRAGTERGRVQIGGSLAWGASRAVLRPDGGVLSAVDSPGSIGQWETRTWRRLATLFTPSPVQSLRYDGDAEESLVAATRDAELIRWPAALATAVPTAPAMQSAPTATAISPSGGLAAIVDWGSISIWDTRTLKPLWRRSVEPRSVTHCRMRGEASVEAFSVAGGSFVLDARTGANADGKPGEEPEASDRERPRVTAGGVTLAVNGGEREFRGSAPVLAACLSPGGSRLAGVCRDGSVFIWDVESGEAAAHLRLAWTNTPAEATNPDRYAVSVGFRGSDERTAALVIASYSGIAGFETELPDDTILTARDRAVRAHALLDPLLRRHGSVNDTRAALLADGSIPRPLRDETLSILDVLGDHAASLNSQAWSRVASPSRTPAEFAKGLELATRAAEILPGSPLILNTLAVAQWRTGDAKGALATIRRIETLAAGPREPLSVIDLAIATLASERLGESDAPQWRERLRAARAALDPTRDPESAAFSREAGESPR